MDQSQQDQYHGVGGSYRVDPHTGIRTRVEGPPLPDAAGADSQAPAVAVDVPPQAGDQVLDQPGRNGRKAKE